MSDNAVLSAQEERFIEKGPGRPGPWPGEESGKPRVPQTPEFMSELRRRRSIFLGLRGVLGFVVLALLVYSHEAVSTELWLLGTGFLVSNLLIPFLPLLWFQRPIIPYVAFFLDLAALTTVLYTVSGVDSESLLLYYLTVFMATLGEDVRKSVGIAFAASAVYVWLRLGSSVNLLMSPEALMRIPLFFVTALSSGYLAQQVRVHKKQLRDLKEIQNTLEAELGRSVVDLARSEDLRSIAQASLRWFRNLVEDLDAIVWEADAPTLQFTFVSRQAEELLGYSIERWLKDPNFWAKHVHPEDRENAVNLMRQALYAGRGHEFEFRMIAADGRPVWLRNTLRVVRAPDGQAMQLRGVMVDISKRRQAEENLAASQNRLRTIIDAEPACVKVVSPDGTLLEMNAAGLAMFDAQSPEQVVGKPVYSMIHPDDCERFRALHERVCRGQEGTLEFRTVGLRGTERWCEMHAVPLRNEKNQVVAALSVTRDVTERKRAREGLEKLSRQNALILNSAGEGIYGLDIEGKATFVNATAAQMLGWTVEELIGQPMHTFLHHTKPDGTPYPLEECPIYAAFRDGAVHHVVDEKFWRKDGTSFPVEYISNPIRENEKVAGAVVTFKDVTEHKKLEEQLRQAQKMEAVGRLAGGVAHDFNNLLTIIGGYSQLLLQRMGPEDPSRPHVTEIKLAGDRAGALTRQLLAFSRRQILTPQVLDLNDVVGNVEKMLRRLIGEDVELATLQAPNLGRVKADPGQIEQVLMNLAVNARDAMPHGGKLTIETANVILHENFGPGPVHVKPGPYVMLKVCDTGCGMTAEVQKHLFEPFFTTKEKGKGTGLGLAMVYGIVKQSGGYIWVDSQPGEGATFTIHLPQVEEVVKTAEPGRTYSALPRGSETVLLVEDEAALRSLVRGILVSAGYNVLEAGHSVDALLISHQHQGPIHLLLTDIVMPGMTGRELADQLCIFHSNMKVLYVSGYTDDAYIQHGVLKAQAAFLQKPFTPEALARKVREVLDARRGGAPPASGGVSQ